MNMQPLSGGFSDVARQSSVVFRAVLDAMSRPGTWHKITGATPPAPLSAAAGALVLTLADPNAPIDLAGEWDSKSLRQWITFHSGAAFTGADQAAFAVGAWADLQPLDRFTIGTSEYPDRSATLIVELDHKPVANARFTGPGIDGHVMGFCPGERPTEFPLGIDLILTCGDELMAIPRSTKLEFI